MLAEGPLLAEGLATVTHRQCLVPPLPSGVYKGPLVIFSFTVFISFGGGLK